MEELAKLPPLALTVFGAVLAFIFAARYLGLFQGMKASEASGAHGAHVAAVIVDPTALNRLTEEAAKLVDALDRLIEVGEKMSRSEDHMATEMDRIREELRIQRELQRSR